jgi:acyl-[acyl-carrier-protein]-phospholipid O-acyltransferase / long-chain-fatty-acid--[acyl-carrier-protein] ligase
MDYSTETEIKIKQGKSKFISMSCTYFLGVFNDNFFKQAAMLLAVSLDNSQLQGTATKLFALPFILFSAHAGWLADTFPKRQVVICSKLLEFCAMLFGAYGVITLNWSCILAMIFIMALQSTIFGPALNGSIPELYPEEYITSANAIIKLVSTLAILVGMGLAGIALDQNWFDSAVPFGRVLVGTVVLITAIIGIIISFGVPSHQTAATNEPFPWAGPVKSLTGLWNLQKDKLLLLAVIGDLFFYFLSSLLVQTINTLGLIQLGFSKSMTSILAVSLMLGICGGSFLAAKLTKNTLWYKYVVISTLGIGFSLLGASTGPLLPKTFDIFCIFFFFCLTGCFGGLLLIPLTSYIQIKPAANEKGKIIAISNFAAFSGIFLSGEIFSILDPILSPSKIIFLLGVFSILSSIGFWWMIKQNSVK